MTKKEVGKESSLLRVLNSCHVNLTDRRSLYNEADIQTGSACMRVCVCVCIYCIVGLLIVGVIVGLTTNK